VPVRVARVPEEESRKWCGHSCWPMYHAVNNNNKGWGVTTCRWPWAAIKALCVVPACVSVVGNQLWTMRDMPFYTVPMPPLLLLRPIVVLLYLAAVCRPSTSCPASSQRVRRPHIIYGV
jgi:hypothetical protein